MEIRNNTVKVKTWNELNEVLFLDSWKESLHRFRSGFAFRGMEDSQYELTTSLMRLASCERVRENLPLIEEKLLFAFRMYAQRLTDPGTSFWYWLSVAQHHGLPTRLLDWTWSPYVAMHFATANLVISDRNTDAVIWRVNTGATHEYLPPKLRDMLNEAVALGFYAEMMDEVSENLEEFDNLSTEKGDFVVFFEPPSLDDRIVNQFALFSLMSNRRLGLDEWLEEKQKQSPEGQPLYLKIIIPASLKWEVRDKLDLANITERVLFPGLDGLSTWLKRHYSCGPDSEAQDTCRKIMGDETAIERKLIERTG